MWLTYKSLSLPLPCRSPSSHPSHNSSHLQSERVSLLNMMHSPLHCASDMNQPVILSLLLILIHPLTCTTSPTLSHRTSTTSHLPSLSPSTVPSTPLLLPPLHHHLVLPLPLIFLLFFIHLSTISTISYLHTTLHKPHLITITPHKSVKEIFVIFSWICIHITQTNNYICLCLFLFCFYLLSSFSSLPY